MLSGLSNYVKNVKKSIQTAGHSQQKAPSLGRVRVGNREVEEIKLLAQGGYAYVYKVKDTSNGTIYALKKMICQSQERLQTAKNEIQMMRQLPNHPNILACHDSAVEQRDGVYYVYVLMEFCEGGSVFDLMEKYESTKLSENQVVFVMREICEGVKALHSCKPPIAHRDLKIENVLLSNKKFKLCDFGSCSTSVVDFAQVHQSQYSNYEEEYDKNTTLMYRPPEMCDPYQKQVVNEKADVWMIGCILHTICYYKHPFVESSKLSIVNAAFSFPKDDRYPPKIVDLIRNMLTPSSKHRPSIFEVSQWFQNYFDLDRVKLNPDAERVKNLQAKQEMEMSKFQHGGSNAPKFNGDIPIEELMKLQKQVASGSDGSSSQKNLKSGLKMGGQYSDTGPYGSPQKSHNVRQAPNSSEKPHRQAHNPHHQIGLQHFNSSPGLQQPPSNDWYNFDNSNKGQVGNPSNFAPTNNRNNSSQPIKKDEKIESKWQNFDFGSAPTTQSTNTNTNTNSNNAWALNGWGNSNQSQGQNAPNKWQNNNNQNNVANNFGNFNQGSNNGFNQAPKQNQAPIITDDLLDLADTQPVKKDTAAGIMSLYI